MLNDIASPERKYIGERIGTYNKKFYEKFGKQIVKQFGQDAKLVEKMDHKKYLILLNQINQKVNEISGQLGQGYEKLSTFSEWLDNLDCNDFYN